MDNKEIEKLTQEIVSLRRELEEQNKILKTATNWMLEALSLISRDQGYYYESDKPLR